MITAIKIASIAAIRPTIPLVRTLVLPKRGGPPNIGGREDQDDWGNPGG